MEGCCGAVGRTLVTSLHERSQIQTQPVSSVYPTLNGYLTLFRAWGAETTEEKEWGPANTPLPV